MPSPRDLPSVDQLLRRIRTIDGLPTAVVTNEVRALLAERRRVLEKSGEAGVGGDDMQAARPLAEIVETRLAALASFSLRRVINATGVVLHTNLGRAPLAAFTPLQGYSNLEYDLAAGRRGRRDDHLSPLLERLLGKSTIVVNNNAAAVYLVLNELAVGGEVIVSRGELIEIGDGFRIPDIMARSGAILREVGTTNRTLIEDYERAISDRTKLILRVHRSNFHMTGFTARPAGRELARLGKAKSIPVFEDLGSGSLVDLRKFGVDEPTVAESVSDGMDLISFSCDKLLGGPQAGIVAGENDLVQRVRRNPMYRAFRVDKLIIQSLEASLQYILREDWRQIPALRMIMTSADELRERAERVAGMLAPLASRVRESESLIGGGSTPEQSLPSWVIELSVADANSFERRLRESPVPVIARIEEDRVLLDLRTVSEDEEAELIKATLAASS